MAELDLVAIGGVLLAWLLLLFALRLCGRRSEARALCSFLPDCVALLRGLLSDDRVSRGRKLVLLGLVGYLLMPIDLVPDFVPVVGLLDDVLVAAVALRLALRSGGPGLLREHWKGPDETLAVVMRVAFGAAAGHAA